MSVRVAVERDLAGIAERDVALAKSGLAAAALELASRMDDPENSATSVAGCARALAEALATLRALVPPVAEVDRVDELAARRTDRVTG